MRTSFLPTLFTYTQCYNITGAIAYGDYTGTITVSLLEKGNEEPAASKEINLNGGMGAYSFSHIPKGTYTLTAKWLDGEMKTVLDEVIRSAHLENLKQRYPEIEKGPFFLGLSEINDSGAQILTFVAICQENIKYWIQRIMNWELKLLFESNDIQLGEPGDE